MTSEKDVVRSLVTMTMRESLEQRAREGEFEIIFFDGLDDAILGLCEHFGEHGHELRVLYDRQKCLDIFAAQADGDYEAAQEWFDFNVSGAYVGKATPAFLQTPEEFQMAKHGKVGFELERYNRRKRRRKAAKKSTAKRAQKRADLQRKAA